MPKPLPVGVLGAKKETEDSLKGMLQARKIIGSIQRHGRIIPEALARFISLLAAE